DASLLDYADSIFWDAYKEGAYGGTGHLSDWEGYRLNRELHPDHRWILAGGLGPRNLKAAVEETGSSFVDMVSSVESSPGLKDLDKLKAVRDSLLSVTS
ncbi:MAG: phosphoribosylanthranilate isomerase, partial [Verrucomicrobiota bacterium]